jgi:hypothetical protein
METVRSSELQCGRFRTRARLVLAIVVVLDTRQQRGQRRGRHGRMAFDHETLDLYRLAVLFSQLGGRAAR